MRSSSCGIRVTHSHTHKYRSTEPGTAAPVLGGRRLESESDHSPPPPVEVKNVWSFTFTPQHCYLLQPLDNEVARPADLDVLPHGFDSSPLGNQNFRQSERLNGWDVQLGNTWQQRKATLFYAIL